MANTVDENLKLFLQADSSIAREVGMRIHENYAPEAGPAPYIWFRLAGTDYERTLGDAPTNAPFRYRFDIEIWARSIRHARTIGALVASRLDSYTGSFGDSTVKGIFVEQQPDDYEPIAGAVGLHLATQSVEVIP